MTNLLAGIDIGGTKCSVGFGRMQGTELRLISQHKFPTAGTPDELVEKIGDVLQQFVRSNPAYSLAAIGISCGGPLNSRTGMIYSPPNLPGWDEIDVCRPFRERFAVPTALQNDANACALAEWRWGAGRGCAHLIFLTFGTGMGAGLILNGRLYTGANDMAGEIGHIRMQADGPSGYGKKGSFEGFCSGGGMDQLIKKMTAERLSQGIAPSFCLTEADLPHLTIKQVAEAAIRDDPLAKEIYRIVGTELGKGLAILVDLLNPECIIIGSIYERQQSLLGPIVLQELQREALARSLAVCRIVPSRLGDQVGDFASLSVAWNALHNQGIRNQAEEE